MGHDVSCEVRVFPPRSTSPVCDCGFAEALAREVQAEAELRDEMSREYETDRLRDMVNELRSLGYTVIDP